MGNGGDPGDLLPSAFIAQGNKRFFLAPALRPPISLASLGAFHYPTGMEARQYLFGGRVQGVGFRYSTKRLATGFDLVGWVRNLPDGRVELQIMGEPEELDDFIAELHDSPLGHHILEQEQRLLPPLEEVAGFSIRE